MKRKDIENIARQRLYTLAPELTSHLASEIIASHAFQKWADRVERERPHGVIATWRRLFGRRGGLSPEQQDLLEDLVRKATKKL